jgi:hypothetical protein
MRLHSPSMDGPPLPTYLVGRLYVGVLNAVLPLPVAWVIFHTESPTVFYLLSLPLNLLLALWIGPGATNIRDLVMPRMRGTASAAYLMVITFVGLALGLYSVGRISVATGFRMMAIGVVLIGLAIRHLPRGESSPLQRATRAGEVIDAP